MLYHNHDEENCATIADDLKIRRMKNAKYSEYIHELAMQYSVEISEDMDDMIQNI